MSRALVIVESPTKARTLSRYLGRQFEVKATVGHIKDLPPNRFGVRIEEDFRPEYQVIKGKQKVLTEIRKASSRADRIYLASDPDREGEAIAYHVAEELRVPQDRVYRVLIHEMTEQAVREAIAHPGRVDLRKVHAQQARRVLDRIVGYTLSPLLWDKVRRGLSAGRVQSVAVRLVCDREAAIRAFQPEEYWSVTAHLQAAVPPPFRARLIRFRGEEVHLPDEAATQRLLEALEGATFVVQRVERKTRRRNPPPPFTTSRLQQEAARRLRFPAKKTMALAQRLYEGVDLGEEGPVGLITYMRTDSVRVSEEAQSQARQWIQAHLGAEALPPRPPVYRNRKGIQDAHEAIRPTAVARTPEQVRPYLDPDAYQLYRLIWTRFVASQMAPALLEVTTVEIQAGEASFRATGQVIRDPGFLRLGQEGVLDPPREVEGQEEGGEGEDEERILPPLEEGMVLHLERLEPRQHFTQPPPRYTEASLIRELEEKGIGRPSTYAVILSTIQERGYVEKREGRFHPTPLGEAVTRLLTEHFPELLDVGFTARMEEELDEIEEGQRAWIEAVRDFYGPFSQRLDRAQQEMKNLKTEETPTDIVCDRCGKQMVIRWGRRGYFLACSGWPQCRNTKEFTWNEDGSLQILEPQAQEATGVSCPQCGAPMVVRSGRYGRFLACSNYPQCKGTQPLGLGIPCPVEGCGGELVERRSRNRRTFFACNRYPACRFALWQRPVPHPCPQCGAPFLVERKTRGGVRWVCHREDCDYQTEPLEAVPTLQGVGGSES